MYYLAPYYITNLYPLAAEHLQAQHSAIKMLYGRIKTILEYVKAVRSGDIPMNHEILRDCKSLCQRLPVLDSAQFQEDFFDVSQIHLSEPIKFLLNSQISPLKPRGIEMILTVEGPGHQSLR